MMKEGGQREAPSQVCPFLQGFPIDGRYTMG